MARERKTEEKTNAMKNVINISIYCERYSCGKKITGTAHVGLFTWKRGGVCRTKDAGGRFTICRRRRGRPKRRFMEGVKEDYVWWVKHTRTRQSAE